MTIERYSNSFKGKVDTTTETFKLIVKLIDELTKRGIEVGYINGIGSNEEWKAKEIGEKYISVDTVYRRNGTAANASVDIECMIKTSTSSSRRIDKVRVKVGASDKVISKRIDTILEKMA